MSEAMVTEIIVEAVQRAGVLLDACEQPNIRRGPLLFTRGLVGLWKQLGRASEWGDPSQIDHKLSQFVGAYAAPPEPVGGVRAGTYHELGLAIAARVAIAGANSAKAARLLELGITAGTLASNGGADLVQALALREAQGARLDIGCLRRNWQRVRKTVLSIVPGVDAVALSARIREESARTRAYAPLFPGFSGVFMENITELYNVT